MPEKKFCSIYPVIRLTSVSEVEMTDSSACDRIVCHIPYCPVQIISCMTTISSFDLTLPQYHQYANSA